MQWVLMVPPWMWSVRPLLLYVYVISKWTTNSQLSGTSQLIVYLKLIFYNIMVLSWTVVIIQCLWGRIVNSSSQWTSNKKIQKVVMHPLVVYVHHVTWRFLEEQLCFLMQYFQPPAIDTTSVMLIEPVLNLLNYLCIAHFLSCINDNQATIQVMNISPSPIKLFKGMKLGIVTTEQNILSVSEEESKSTLQIPSFDNLDFPHLSSSERTELVNLYSYLPYLVTFFHQLIVLGDTLLLLNILSRPLDHPFASLFVVCVRSIEKHNKS